MPEGEKVISPGSLTTKTPRNSSLFLISMDPPTVCVREREREREKKFGFSPRGGGSFKIHVVPRLMPRKIESVLGTLVRTEVIATPAELSSGVPYYTPPLHTVIRNSSFLRPFSPLIV